MRHFTQNRGITIVELVVGVGILAFAIAGPMTLASSSLKATKDARNELVATHLAEEGIEVVHSVRDNNSAQDNPQDPTFLRWMIGVTTPCVGNGCVVDVTAHTPLIWGSPLVGCTNVDCALENTVYVNPATGLYRQSTIGLSAPWIPSVFKRTVSVVVVSPTREVQVTSTVTYPGSRGGVRTIRVSEVLYNWFPSLY